MWSLSPCTESSGMLGTQPDPLASLEIRIFGELCCFSSAHRSLRGMLTSPSRGEPQCRAPEGAAISAQGLLSRSLLTYLTYRGASTRLMAGEPVSRVLVSSHFTCGERLTTHTLLMHTFFSWGTGVLCSYLCSRLLVPKRGSALHWLKILYLAIISAYRKVSNTRLEPKAHKVFTQILLLLIFCTVCFSFVCSSLPLSSICKQN